MKTTANFRNILIATTLVLSSLSFTACSAGDESDSGVSAVNNEVVKTENSFSFKLKALASQKDVTLDGGMGSAELYIFDKDNDFVKKVAVDANTITNRSTIQVTCPGSDRITVIALGGLNGSSENVTPMTQANIITDLTVSLKQNNGIANLPSDIFYGQMTLTANQTKSGDVPVLEANLKVAAIDILFTNAVATLGEGEYYVKVKQAQSAINYKGDLTGNAVEFIIPARITATGAVSTDKTAIMPSNNVTIELYKDDVMVVSVSADKNGKNLSTVAGTQTAIKYDFARAIATASATGFNTNFIFAA